MTGCPWPIQVSPGRRILHVALRTIRPFRIYVASIGYLEPTIKDHAISCMRHEICPIADLELSPCTPSGLAIIQSDRTPDRGPIRPNEVYGRDNNSNILTVVSFTSGDLQHRQRSFRHDLVIDRASRQLAELEAINPKHHQHIIGWQPSLPKTL
ncbi:hypothetical protein RF11_03691 [Thelohanellus kitauei]|uniref:Uncharacterized protein n=1 Tax=Thelohanellus kitauei TaxID=669202 RepID=A0A0C2MVS2_THEKT|nr:hypothetical protein RF11_03691 [Thelohanellus kitauei]